MKYLNQCFTIFILTGLLIFSLYPQNIAMAQERRITITEPNNQAVLTNPVKICMKVEGLILEPADLGVREGHGHHHIVFSSLPLDLSKPLKRKQAIHLDKAQTCIKLRFEKGNHIIIGLFAYANHVPYDPPIMDRILISIK